MSDVMDRVAPLSPPAPRARHVLEQRAPLERELADLNLRVAETALAAYEDKPGGRENLAALDAAIRTAEFQLEAHTGAHQLALRLDRDAVAAWRTAVDAADPAQMVSGITAKACCKRCSEASGCIITGNHCAHPVLTGALNPGVANVPAIRGRWVAAAKKLGVHR